MDPEMLGRLGGWIGGILGALIGISGGLLGTYLAVRNTRGPRERAFAIKVAVGCWVLVLAFVAGLILVPGWYRHLLWIPYALLLVTGILWFNRTQARIRQEEAGHGP